MGNKHTTPCLICGSSSPKVIGIRGNREYSGADISATPHYVTDVLQCQQCGFHYTPLLPAAADELEQAHYSRPASYHGPDGHNCAVRLQLIKKYVSGGSLLDVGAGKGEFVAAALSEGFQASGIEPSAAFAAYASQVKQLPVQCGYLDKSGMFEGRRFDVITLFHVLEHVHQPHQLIALLAEYLNPGGVLMIEVPNTNGLLLKIIDLFYRLSGLRWSGRLSPFHPPFHRFGYSSTSLSYLLQHRGYDIVSIHTLSGFQRKMEGKTSLLTHIRDSLMKCIDWLGNRELLLVIARPVATQQ